VTFLVAGIAGLTMVGSLLFIIFGVRHCSHPG
jgi:hypothetical protein